MLLSQTTEYNTKGNILDLQLEYHDLDKIDSVKTQQRILQTHLPLRFQPTEHVKKGRKIVYVNRNPKDRYVSLYVFLSTKVGVPKWTWADFYNTQIVNGK
jgi:hypothetical protein